MCIYFKAPNFPIDWEIVAQNDDDDDDDVGIRTVYREDPVHQAQKERISEENLKF